MSDPSDEPPPRRRARRRATAPQGPAKPTLPASAPEQPREITARTRSSKAARTDRPARSDAARSDRDLAGAVSSQIGPTGAMRARDLNRPTPEDLAEAEARLEIVRRHWAPTTDAPEPRPARRRRP